MHKTIEGFASPKTAAPRLITLIAFASLGGAAMNMFMPSLPAMAVWFDTSYATIQLSVALYLGISGVLQLVVGPLTDRYGRRPVVLGALVVFLLATLGTVLAPNFEIFMAFRLLQATIATSMALSRAIVRDIASDGEAASMMGWLAMGFAMVPMIAPVLGGILEKYLFWQASFLFLLVFGAAVFVLVFYDLHETSTRKHNSLLAQIRAYPRLLRSKIFWVYALTAATTSGVYYCYLGAAPALGARVYGLDSAAIGMYLGVTGFGYVAGSFVAARLSKRLGMRPMIVLGCWFTLIVALAMLGLELMQIRHPLLFFGAVAFVSIGNGITLPSANVGMMSVHQDLIGSASGLGSALIIGLGAVLSYVAASLTGSGESGLWVMILMCCVGAVAVTCVHSLKGRLNT